MSRTRSYILFFFLFSVFLFSFSIHQSSAQDPGWALTEITSNPGIAPSIDGIKEPTWGDEANITYYDFEGGRRLTFYVQHVGKFLYFLIELKFRIEQDPHETISLYFASSNKTNDIMDKKQITLFNATTFGNSSSIARDLYKKSGGNYTLNTKTENFEGAASVAESTLYRYYEYKIRMNSTTTNKTEDAVFEIYNNYALKVGINTTNNLGEEAISDVLLLQIGPKSVIAPTSPIGIWDFDLKVYILIVLIVVTSIFGIYGIGLFSVRSKLKSTIDLETIEEEKD